MMKRFVVFAGLCLTTQVLLAQINFSVDWFTIDGGGGTSRGGPFSLSGTIGQADANSQPMIGGNYSLAGGFWSLFAVQTPDAPSLRIFLSGTNTVVLTWPAPSNFTLQQTTTLDPINWVTVTNSPAVVGNEKQLLISPTAGSRFYRLKYP